MSIKGNTKKWVTSDTQVPLAEWVTEEVSTYEFRIGAQHSPYWAWRIEDQCLKL